MERSKTRAHEPGPVRFERLPGARTREQEFAELRSALLQEPPRLPARYFYDEVGSRLFEEICALPEYYPTRTEKALLEEHARDIVAASGASELVELGSGSGQKTRLLLSEMLARGPALYVPFEISEEVARRSAAALVRDLAGLAVHGLVGDFTRDLGHLPEGGPRLVIFLGGTIGNFEPPEARAFLRRLHAVMGPGDTFLLGTDLVKDVARLEAAYADARGVTAEFNRNILRVVNEVADGDFEPELYEHRARYVVALQRIEMWLVARAPQRVRLRALDLELELAAGAGLLTEVSAKFTRASAARLLAEGGFEPIAWYADRALDFGLTLARRS